VGPWAAAAIRSLAREVKSGKECVKAGPTKVGRCRLTPA